jgi:hypothetical protein
VVILLIQWRNDNNNRTGAYFEANNFRIFSIINASSTDIGTAITTAVGDIIDITVIKNEKNWSFLLKVNGVMQDISGLSQTSFNTNYQNLNGKLAIQELAGNPCYIESATITSTKVADHANTSSESYKLTKQQSSFSDNTGVQSIATGTSDISISLDTDDEGEMFDASSPTQRTIRETGRYLLILDCEYASNATGTRDAKLKVNGTQVAHDSKNAASTSTTGLNLSTVEDLSKDDVITFTTWQNSGGALNTTCKLRIVRQF